MIKNKINKKTKDYRNYLLSDKWYQLRKQMIENSGGKCSECGSPNYLHVHHKTYKNFANEDIRDLEVLCKTCHHKRHNIFQPNLKNKKKNIYKLSELIDIVPWQNEIYLEDSARF